MGIFKIIQQRFAKAKCICIANSMDILAILNKDGNISIHRIFTWEKVYTKSKTDLKGEPSLIEFSVNGKFLVVVGYDSFLKLINIESGEVIDSITSSFMPSFNEVVSISWVKRVIDNDLTWDHLSNKFTPVNEDSVEWSLSSYFSTIELGFPELKEMGNEEDTDLKNQLDVKLHGNDFKNYFEYVKMGSGDMIKLDHSVLVILTSDRHLLAYKFGILPLFKLSLYDSPAFDNLNWKVSVGTITSNFSICQSDANIFSQLEIPHILSICKCEFISKSCEIILSMLYNLNRLFDYTNNLSKKWKDANRVILAKISLFQSTLDGYELSYTPVQFFYSIILCGAWHPAVNGLSNQWNEQGTARLKSSVDSVSKTILFTLIGKMLPISININMMVHELHNYCKSSKTRSIYDGQLKLISKLTKCAEHLLMKVEETIAEARRSRECMLLFIQFIRECSTPSTSPPALIAASKVDVSLRSKLLAMFDPRILRADISGKNSQAESITGTHLYAYFLDKKLEHINSDKKYKYNYESKNLSYSRPESLIKIFEMMKNNEEYDSGYEEIDTRSLLSQINCTKNSLQNLFQSFFESSTSIVGTKNNINKEFYDGNNIKLYDLKINKTVHLNCSDMIHTHQIGIFLSSLCHLKHNFKLASDGRLILNDANLIALGHHNSSNVCNITILCKFTLDNASYQFMSTITLPESLPLEKIRFYNVNIDEITLACVNPVSPVDGKNSVKKRVLKINFSSIEFREIPTISIENQNYHAIDEYCNFSPETNDLRIIEMQSDIDKIIPSAARGLLTILGINGQLVVLDFNDFEEEKEEEEDDAISD